MPEFSKHYRTVALDVRGHGGTSKPDQPYSIKGFAEDFREFMKQLKIPRAHILGLSMGGAIAQQFALAHPEMIQSRACFHLRLYRRTGRTGFHPVEPESQEGGYPAFFDEVVKLAFTPQYIAANPGPLVELKSKRVAINSPVAIGRAAEACLTFNLKDEIAGISVPTLVVSGRNDVFTPVHLAEQIHRSIRGSEWKILEEVGHNLYIVKSLQMAQVVLDFLKKHRE